MILLYKTKAKTERFQLQESPQHIYVDPYADPLSLIVKEIKSTITRCFWTKQNVMANFYNFVVSRQVLNVYFNLSCNSTMAFEKMGIL